MLSTQKKYVDYTIATKSELEKITKIDTKAKELANEVMEFNKLSQEIEAKELLIPITGAFSAGKSSLLNSFIGNRYLQTDIEPETALAAELRFSSHEYMEIVDNEGNVSTFEIDNIDSLKDKIEQLKQNAGNYNGLRLYINSENLKNIQPLILVDMPGFDSPLDAHNEAINKYLNKGVYYIVLTSIENGTITKSMTNQINTILELKRDVDFFVTKSDLRNPSEVERVVEYIKDSIKDEFDEDKEVIAVNHKNGQGFENIVKQIDVEQLFDKIYKQELQHKSNKVIENLNFRINAMQQNKEKMDALINDLDQAQKNIQQKQQQIKNNTQKYSDKADEIANMVAQDLNNKINFLTDKGLKNGSSAVNSEIKNSIDRITNRQFRKAVISIQNDISSQFTQELSMLNDSMSDYLNISDWSFCIKDRINFSFEGTENSIDWFGIGVNIVSVAAILSKFNPILATIATIGSKLLGLFRVGGDKKQDKNEIRDEISLQIENTIPSIVSELFTGLNESFEDIIDKITDSTYQILQHEINQKIIITNEEIEKLGGDDLDKILAQYQESNEKIKQIAEQTF